MSFESHSLPFTQGDTSAQIATTRPFRKRPFGFMCIAFCVTVFFFAGLFLLASGAGLLLGAYGSYRKCLYSWEYLTAIGLFSAQLLLVRILMRPALTMGSDNFKNVWSLYISAAVIGIGAGLTMTPNFSIAQRIVAAIIMAALVMFLATPLVAVLSMSGESRSCWTCFKPYRFKTLQPYAIMAGGQPWPLCPPGQPQLQPFSDQGSSLHSQELPPPSYFYPHAHASSSKKQSK